MFRETVVFCLWYIRQLQRTVAMLNSFSSGRAFCNAVSQRCVTDYVSFVD